MIESETGNDDRLFATTVFFLGAGQVIMPAGSKLETLPLRLMYGDFHR